MKYFSYALTANELTMMDVCPEAVRFGPCTLHSHELRFAETADIIHNIQSTVEGILWEVPEEYIDMITAIERHERKRQVLVKFGKETFRAWSSSRSEHQVPNGPTWNYWQEIEDAYYQQGLPIRQIVQAIESVEHYFDTGIKR
tara:strand:+ start:229 stop:657 length:429 start_codon:yes stop_codon:yes gene_type:complete